MIYNVILVVVVVVVVFIVIVTVTVIVVVVEGIRVPIASAERLMRLCSNDGADGLWGVLVVAVEKRMSG